MGSIFNKYTYDIGIILKDNRRVLGIVNTWQSIDDWLSEYVFKQKWVTIKQKDTKTAIKTEDISVVYVTEKKEE